MSVKEPKFDLEGDSIALQTSGGTLPAVSQALLPDQKLEVWDRYYDFDSDSVYNDRRQ